MDDDEKEEYPTLSTPRTLPRWVDSEAPGRDSVPQTPGTRIIGGERLLERTPLSEWKREQLMGDGSDLREGVSEEEAQVLIDLGERLAAAQGDEEPMDDLGLGAEDDLGLGAEDEDEEMPLEEDLDEELVNEVIARVARRLRSSE